MKHLQNAEQKSGIAKEGFYSRESHSITFQIQSDPIAEVGKNGLQGEDILLYLAELYRSLNAVIPCRENSLTITKIEEAIHWQKARKENRASRGVEGHQKE